MSNHILELENKKNASDEFEITIDNLVSIVEKGFNQKKNEEDHLFDKIGRNICFYVYI